MGLRYQDAFVLTRNRKLAEYFEKVISKIKYQKSKIPRKNFFEIQRGKHIKYQKFEQIVANLIVNKKISTNLLPSDFVKRVLAKFEKKEVDEKTLNASINRIIEANKRAVEDYRKGKEKAIMFLVGQVMRETKGRADPIQMKELLIRRLRRLNN